MIHSFANKKTHLFFKGETVASFASIAKQAAKRLNILHSATSLMDLSSLPSNRLESLEGDRKGQFSIRISDQWRICFEWRDDGAYEVEITDYH